VPLEIRPHTCKVSPVPKRTDIHRILIIGSGPIVIGQGCEFDYSGVQACRALREEGFGVVLVNSNPATIMTDPEFADATYIEPITPEAVEKILAREKAAGTPVDALLPTLGGQTGLNTGMACHEQGILERFGVKMIGADPRAIHRGEDRQAFKDLMIQIGLEVPRSRVVTNIPEAEETRRDIGLPLIIRPAFTLGGTGGGIAYTADDFQTIVQRGLDASPVKQVLIEQSVIGWKEFELEVMRDRNDNVVIICSIENVDPMGVHTGDSITVAPVQTLTDKEYQRMRDAAIAVIRAVGVETGGSNIQFAVNPENGRMVVVEMNPRVSRSSALASKATGFPIAKIAAKLAVGFTLDELANDITSVKKNGKYERYTSACFEPTIDYCVVKIPRWTFEKFPDADPTLTTQMKSVGEAMAIGRTFKEALQKGIRSMEIKQPGLGLGEDDRSLTGEGWPIPEEELRRALSIPNQRRLFYIRYAMKMGWNIDRIHELTKIDRWFLAQIQQLVDFEQDLANLNELNVNSLRRAKQYGYSDAQLARVLKKFPWNDNKRWPASWIRSFRQAFLIDPVFKLVDTCAAEFEAATPYYYSTYEAPFISLGAPSKKTAIQEKLIALRAKLPSLTAFLEKVEQSLDSPDHSWSKPHVCEDEVRLTDRPKVVIIGGGPNRIGQGIEFDYCCVHAAFAMKELGLESVMINSNPETVSTDYDTSDLLFFEPLTHEDVLNICERLNGRPFSESGGLVKGVIVQFGGQTPLNLARGLKEAGVPILGTTVESLDAAGDREQFRDLLARLELKQPVNGIARGPGEAKEIARRIGYPVLVRPSFVLGGRAMEIVSDEKQLDYYMANALEASSIADAPILVDKFLDAATEVDVDCVADFDPTDSNRTGQAIIIGVMEHIEEAGIHSGDSACALPPYSLAPEIVARLKEQTCQLAAALRVRGLMNVQYAVKGSEIYVIEVNPRASRTVPFVSKATGVSWAKIAAKVMAGKSLAELGAREMPDPRHVSVKEVVFPFSKFPGVDVILGPEMRSTGEVMGIDTNFPMAFAKSQVAAGTSLPTEGTIFISVRVADHEAVVPIARSLAEMGFNLLSTTGTHAVLKRHGIPATLIPKLAEGRPNIIDHIKDGKVQLIINTPTKKGPSSDEGKIRASTVIHRVPIVTTLTGAAAAAKAIAAMKRGDWQVRPLQSYFR
jgi:carbamoyl-phosphate synthase large subunit